ncbi:hypothetical protein PoB_005805100 [Plakobranchus ocellatus]|uniref:Uncharacterized protein n=1 Tax=Plakobranchus ocellatus TaxID=259542 RepID=A0AAV4CJ79_9GAST|nr:hypothetical protein PoB_005805100 [Plakobranchus ocellatus]
MVELYLGVLFTSDTRCLAVSASLAWLYLRHWHSVCLCLLGFTSDTRCLAVCARFAWLYLIHSLSDCLCLLCYISDTLCLAVSDSWAWLNSDTGFLTVSPCFALPQTLAVCMSLSACLNFTTDIRFLTVSACLALPQTLAV